jgi:hypothetical protein
MTKPIILVRTQETIDLLLGMYDRFDIVKKVMGDQIRYVEGIDMYTYFENFFSNLNEKFKAVGDFPVVKIDEKDVASLIFLGDLVGVFFAEHGDERDIEFLSNLTTMFNQLKGNQSTNSIECWEFIKETELT